MTSLLLLKQLRLAQNPIAYKNNSSVDELVGVVGVVGLAGLVWRKKLNVTPKEKKRKKAKALLFYIAKCLTE